MRHAQQSSSVLVLATGGTIGMHASENGLTPDPDFSRVLAELLWQLCTPLGVEPRMNQLQPAIDSANADADTAPSIARAIRARVRLARPRGVVVLHGTDTLAFTAARLSFELADLGVPVVVTGSQLPHGAPHTDAARNLTLAIRTAIRAAPGAPVSVAFGGNVLPAVRATKHDSTNIVAFRAESPLATHPVGVPSPIPKAPAAEPSAATAAESATVSFPARILAYRLVPAVTAADLRSAVAAHPDGLVLECYGSGNAPMQRPGITEALRDICAHLPVVATTQCAVGGVDLARYAVGRELAEIGVIDGSDLTLEAALAKLGFLLDAGFRGEELRALMQRNLVGECRTVD